MTDRTCRTCLFRGPDGSKAPTCRRYPPTVLTFVSARQFQRRPDGLLTGWTDTNEDVTLWPSVSLDAWCGEYQTIAGARH